MNRSAPAEGLRISSFVPQTWQRVIQDWNPLVAMTADQDLYNQLAYYTLSHPNPLFIHQHIVDAYTAQSADEFTKPIAITFALVGLYLYIEKNFTGRQVQQMHLRLANRRKHWLKLTSPAERGSVTASEVLAAPPGPERDQKIRSWCMAVWQAWETSQPQIRNLLKRVALVWVLGQQNSRQIPGGLIIQNSQPRAIAMLPPAVPVPASPDTRCNAVSTAPLPGAWD
jgi:hypothetical protein